MGDNKVGDVDESKHGKPLKFDPKFKGPIQNRSCTDIICCLIFMIFIAGVAVVGAFAFVYGEPELLIYPEDSDGNLCGLGTQKGKPNLFFFDLIKCGRMGPGVFVNGCPTPQICVTECPKENFAFLKAVIKSDKSLLQYCKAGVDPSASPKTIEQLVEDEDCAGYWFESKSVLNRCVPSLAVDAVNALTQTVDSGQIPMVDAANNTVTSDLYSVAQTALELFLKAKEYSEKIIQDVVASWWMLVIGVLLAMVISFIWIILMRWVAGPMVWLSIIAFLCLFLACTAYCIYYYIETKDTTESYTIHMVIMQFEFAQSKFWLISGIIAAVVLTISMLILFILCNRIRVAIALIEEGSKAVGKMMFTLIWPFVPYVFQLGVVAYWLLVAVYLASTGRARSLTSNNITFPNGTLNEDEIKTQVKELFQSIPCDVNASGVVGDACGFLKYGQEGFSIYLQIFNLFMLFWMVNFFIALGQMTLAGAFASYYWAFEKPRDIPTFPLLSSFGRCLRYHLGSIAFGSFIIAVVQIIRVFLEYLDHKLKKSENEVAKFFLKCLKCCFWCLEKFLRFLNKNAYIMVAVHGKNFCRSAKKAFMLILRNVVRVVVLDKVADFLLFLGKLVIVGVMAFLAYFFFNGQITFLNQWKPNLNFYLVPVVILVATSYVIAAIFFSVYGMAVDTLFLCFLEDLERNDGSQEKPYYMCKSLMKIVGKKNVKETEKK